jgi:hypothetical protein
MIATTLDFPRSSDPPSTPAMTVPPFIFTVLTSRPAFANSPFFSA